MACSLQQSNGGRYLVGVADWARGEAAGPCPLPEAEAQ